MVRVARYLAGNFEARDSPRCNGGRRSTFAGNSALLPAHRIWWETVSLLDVMSK